MGGGLGREGSGFGDEEGVRPHSVRDDAGRNIFREKNLLWRRSRKIKRDSFNLSTSPGFRRIEKSGFRRIEKNRNVDHPLVLPSGDISMGSMFMLEGIIGHVQGSLDFFISSYGDVASWRVTTDRLISLEKFGSRMLAENHTTRNRLLALEDGSLEVSLQQFSKRYTWKIFL